MLGEVVIATAASDGADGFVLGEDEFENGASIVVEAADDGHVGGDLLGETLGFEKIEDEVEFGEALLEGGVVDFEIGEFFDDFGAGAVEID